MKTTRLQGIGEVVGIPAKELKVGDVTVWNYGYTETVTGIEFSKTGKTLKVQIEYVSTFPLDAGKIKKSERKLGAERIVVIK